MRVGILTGGGDCPGLNAAIRGVARRLIDSYGCSVLGIRNGWAGLLNGDTEPLSLNSISGVLHRGGTILGTSRTNPLKRPDGLERVQETVKKLGINAIVAIGGDDTLWVAHQLHQENIPVVGVPKTIDNDLAGTEQTFGFDTAINIATEAIDRLHTTAESHHRVMVVEVMGRHTGWIAIMSGLAGGADCILIPEVPFKLDQVCHLIHRRHERGKTFSIVVVAEGAKPLEQAELVTQDNKLDEFGHVRLGGIGHTLGNELEKRTGLETRVTILGHIQRGGTPTAFDRVLASRFGVAAADLVYQKQFGKMVGLQSGDIVPVDLEVALTGPKLVDMKLYKVAEVFFG